MAVVINRESGLAENLPDESAQAGLQAGTHDVPLYDPQGNAVTASHEDAPDLISQGYSQPKAAELTQMLEHAKYNAPSQQIKTGLEGAASAATFGLSTAAERAAGVNPEDIYKRASYNPGVHALGEAAGLGASMLTGVGEAETLGKAGETVAEHLAPIVGESFAGKVGTQAAKAAIENMAFQGGDEASQLFSSDPNQSTETAMAHIGLAGALGGALGGGFGAASELWKAGPGAKLDGLLDAMQKRAGGVPEELKNAAGITVPPEVEAALGDNPKARSMFQALNESNTSSGEKVQAALQQFKSDAHDAIVSAVGKAPEDAQSVSDYDMGKAAQDKLVQNLKDVVQPISDKYDELEEQFKDAVVSPNARADVANKLSQLIVDNNLLKLPSDAPAQLVNKVLGQLPSQATAQDLRMYIKGVGDVAPYGSETYQIGKQVKGILRELQNKTITDTISTEAPHVLEDYKATQAAYGGARDLIDTLNDRLHVGKYGGPGSFIDAFKSMTPEDVLRRLSPKGDVEMQNLLQKQFPEVSEMVRQAELNKLMKSMTGKGDDAVNASKLFKAIESMTPEMRQFLFKPEQAEQLGALKDLLGRVPAKMNSSGTAKTLDKLWNEVPASAAGMASMLMGHSGPMGYIAGKIGTMLGKEGPDAVRLGMLKFLGSSAPVSSEGLKAAVQMASATLKGETKLNNAVEGIFKGGQKIIEPATADIEKLKKQVDAVQEKPDSLLQMNNKAAHYLPDHGTVLAMSTARNLQYLATLKPNTAPLGILDGPKVASADEEAKYNNALRVAQNPLTVLKSIREGSLTQQELVNLRTMYPALYQRMHNKLMNQVIGLKAEEKAIPYRTKVSMGIFMGQPLDASMQPSSIQSTQLSTMQASQQQAAPKHSMTQLGKMPSMYQTTQQYRESRRSTGH